jgi:hypothetical protein
VVWWLYNRPDVINRNAVFHKNDDLLNGFFSGFSESSKKSMDIAASCHEKQNLKEPKFGSAHFQTFKIVH